MMASELMKAAQPSLMVVEMKDQRIMPTAKYGRNSRIGVLKISPNTSPRAPINPDVKLDLGTLSLEYSTNILLKIFTK
jgi:hypothetical protein